MARKQHTDSALLQRLIDGIESERPQHHRAAIVALVTEGPLFVHQDAIEALPTWSVEAFGMARAEAMQFLRTIVRQRASAVPAQMGTSDPMHFSAMAVGDRVACEVEGFLEDVVKLQLVVLLTKVGLSSVKTCPGPDCRRIFVKTYRREFCSPQCQNKRYMRIKRTNRKIPRTTKRGASTPTGSRRNRETKQRRTTQWVSYDSADRFGG